MQNWSLIPTAVNPELTTPASSISWESGRVGVSHERRQIMRRFLSAVAVLALFFVSGGSIVAGDITYSIVNDPIDQNGYTLSGTITTDGTIGALAPSDFLSWQIRSLDPPALTPTRERNPLPSTFQASRNWPLPFRFPAL